LELIETLPKAEHIDISSLITLFKTARDRFFINTFLDKAEI